MRPLTWGYKFVREIARRMPHFRGEPPVLHPAFAPGGPASIVAHAEGPVPFDTPRIVYSEGDERALEEFVRAMGMRLRFLSFLNLYMIYLSVLFVPLRSVHDVALGELLLLQSADRPSFINISACSFAH